MEALTKTRKDGILTTILVVRIITGEILGIIVITRGEIPIINLNRQDGTRTTTTQRDGEIKITLRVGRVTILLPSLKDGVFRTMCQVRAKMLIRIQINTQIKIQIQLD